MARTLRAFAQQLWTATEQQGRVRRRSNRIAATVSSSTNRSSICFQQQQQRRSRHNKSYSSKTRHNDNEDDDDPPLERRHVRLRTEPDRAWIINPNLSQYIHAMRSDQAYAPNSGLSLSFLGTGAGRSTPARGPSCTALRYDGGTYLFDAGEGADFKVRELSHIAMNTIHKIFITHLHGDHVLGLPTLLLGLQEAAKANTRRTLEIYGPVGLYNLIAVTLSLISAELKHLEVHVYELRGGSRRWVHPGTYKNFPEFQHRSLHRKSIPPNQDGTWTLSTAQEFYSPDDDAISSFQRNRSRGLHIHAAQVSHVPKLQCFGYMVQEPHTQMRKIDAQLAQEAGIRPGKKYNLLKAGFPVMNDDNTRQVHPEEVTQPAIAPRKVAFLGDCQGVPLPMAELCRDADVIVHEATLLESDESHHHKVDRGGHSTAAMAGIFADFCRARVLALNHISAAHEARPEAIYREAQQVIQGGGGGGSSSKNTITTQVQLAYDQMELEIPRGGFATQQQQQQNDSRQSSAHHFARQQRQESMSNKDAAAAWLLEKSNNNHSRKNDNNHAHATPRDDKGDHNGK